MLRRKHRSDAQVPLYKEVERRMMECLASGEWKPGDQIPTESQLAERFQVAIFTVRAGIQTLVDSGILHRHQGKGTFVSLHRTKPLRYQFLRIFNNEGTRAQWDRELISVRRRTATDEAASLLHLANQANARVVYEVLFLLKSEGKTVAVVESMMPAVVFGKVSASSLENTTDNLYAVFQESFGVNVVETQERVRAVRAGLLGARWLGIPASAPMLRIERVAFTYNEHPVELRYYNVRADAYCYFVPSK